MNFPRLLSLVTLGALLLTACVSPTPAATPTSNAPTPTASTTPSPVPPTATPTPAPTATPLPIELTVCQTEEPTSLYRYAEDTLARATAFDALYDGPIDSVGYNFQPVILETLPSLENGRAALAPVTVNLGDTVVDAALGTVNPLTTGVTLAQPDGTWLVYTGTEPAQTVQLSAQFTLKPGLLWADGEPLTAADSLFSYQIAADPHTPHSQFIIARTASYEALDALNARWVGLPGWLDAQFQTRFWPPLPRHVYGTLTAQQLLDLPEAAERPLGWGPFVVSEWIKGDRLLLTRNPNYFRAAEGLPRLDRLTLRFGLSGEQIVQGLLAGTCDIGADSADYSDQMEAILAAQSAGTLSPQFVSTTSFEHLDFGILSADDYDRVLGADLFQDVRFRQAIAVCLDRPALVNELMYGLAEIPDAYLSRAHPLFAADQITAYPFDPVRGQALLDDLNWKDSDGDGVRDNGRRKLSLSYVSGPPASAFRETLLNAVSAQLLTHCGIELRPNLVALEELYAPWPTGWLFGRRFDLGQFPWRAGLEPPCDLYTTEAIPGDQNPGGANNTGYSHPEFDAACRAAQTALDETARRAAHAEAQTLFTRDLPSLPLFFRFKVGLSRPSVTGYRVDTTANSDLWNIEAMAP